MVQIKWTLQARNDLKSIADYISRDSAKYAKLQVLKIRLRTKILETYLYIGRVVPEINREDIRELIEVNYRIIYKVINDSRIDILTIHHSARDLSQREL